MTRRTTRRGGAFGGLGSLIFTALAVVVFLCLLGGLSQLQQGQSTQSRQQLEDAIREAAVACYAAEGVYPPDVAYLEEHYGLQVDETRYVVSYSVFASNLMPDITVLEAES